VTRVLRRVWSRLLGSFAGRRRESELAEEIESHIRLIAEENIRRGLPPQEAYRRGRLQFGSIDSTTESCRDQRGLPVLEVTFQDLRYAFRAIRKSPGFTTVAILSLAIGIGANTAIFSLVNGVLLRPLAYADPGRLFALREISPLFGLVAVNPVHAREFADQCPSLDQVALIRGARVQIAGGGEPASVPGVRVPHNFFRLFGVDPILGRTFLPEEEREGTDSVAIFSESLWRSRFHGDPLLVGKSVLLDGRNYQVAGIVPSSFRPPYARDAVVFRPLVLSRQELARRTGNYNYAAVVRVKPGVNAEQALAEIRVVLARFSPEMKAVLIPMHEVVTGRARLGLWMLAAAVGAVLFIVCVNLANLLLSRLTSRSREAAIRTALGASRGRQFRQALTESLLLAVSGGILGIVFAAWLIPLLAASTTVDIPRLNEVHLDSSVLLYAFSLSLLTGLLFGALPAWGLTRNDPQQALRTGSQRVTEGRHGLRLRDALIGLEVSLSTALLIVAGLLGASLNRLVQVDKGFDSGRVLTLDVGLNGDRYAEAASRERFFDRLLPKLSAIPGVENAGFITALPARGQTWNDPIYLEGDGIRPAERHPVDNRYASPEYFRTMSIVIRYGRGFGENDRGRGVAVLSEKAAKILWPGEPNPVGRHFMGEDDKLKTLVGIVADVRADLHKDPPPTAYYPYWQRPPDGVSLVVRTAGDPAAMVPAVERAARMVEPDLPLEGAALVNRVYDLPALLRQSLAYRRFITGLLGAFALPALLLAALGIYGVVAYLVAQREREIGIRMALGARRQDVLGLVIGEGLRLAGVGVLIGAAGALATTRWLRSELYDTSAIDPLTFVLAAAVLIAIGLLAMLLPARRAAGIDPARTLQAE